MNDNIDFTSEGAVILFESGTLKMFVLNGKYYIRKDVGKFVANEFETFEIRKEQADTALNFLGDWLREIVYDRNREKLNIQKRD